MLYLNENDIMSIISFEGVMDIVDKAFCLYEDKKYEMPNRIQIEYKNNTLLYMPCFLDGIFGTKFLTIFPNNKLIDKPVINGLLFLNDHETGETIGILDGKTVTNIRTGAVGGSAIRHLSHKSVDTLGVIGAGVQGFYQILFACEVRNFQKIFLYNRTIENTLLLSTKLKKVLHNVEIIVVNNVEVLLNSSEVIITATSSYEPVLPNNSDLLKGKVFIGIGSYKPTMREYPDALFKLVSKVYVDTYYACEESGDLLSPIQDMLIDIEDIETFGKFLLSEKKEEELSNKTIFFKSVGMALFDIVLAEQIYLLAKDKKIGQYISLK